MKHTISDKIDFKTILCVFICILINFLGKRFAASMELPLWMDSFGTVFAAYLLGPVSGAIIGCAGNIIYSFWNPTALCYGITSIYIGFSIGILARKKYFENLFKAMSVAGGVTMGSVIISAILNLSLYHGSIGNVWGDGIKDFLLERGVHRYFATAIGELYLDFLDKLVTVLFVFFVIKLYRLRHRMIKKRTAAGLLAFCFCMLSLFPAVSAQASTTKGNSYIRKLYNAQNGLTCGHANDIVQTNDGILWIGSYAGLYRYNGSEFRFMDKFDAVKNVNCLFVDEEGRLWIGTNDNGLMISIHETLVNTLDSTQGLPSDSVRCITQGADGDYYIGTTDSMAVVRLMCGITITNTIAGVNCATSISADENGNVAAVTAEGTLYIIREGKICFETANKESEDKFTACTFDNKGHLFVGTENGNLFIYRMEEKKAVKESRITCEGLTKINQIYFREGGEETAWILSDNGIGLFSETSFGEKKKEHFQQLETGEFNYSIERMTMDYQGNLWFASSRLGLLQFQESVFSNLFSEYGIASSVVNTTLVKDDMLYAGTDDGLVIIRKKDGTLVNNELTKLLAGCRVRCITTGTSEDLWICSYGKGLIHVSEGGIQSYEKSNSGPGARTRVCMKLSDGSMAAGGENGLTIIRKGKNPVLIPYGDELGTAQILSLHEMPDGRLYLGTDGNGIVVLKDGKVSAHFSKEDGLGSGVILRIVADGESGNLFIVTSNGICYMDSDGISMLSNFPYSNNYDIVADTDGELFILGSAGIYVINKKELLSGKKKPDYKLLNSQMGLIGSLTANAWNTLTKDKNLYLSTDCGIFLVNLDNYQPKKRSYRLMVSNLKVDGVHMPIDRESGLTISRNVKSMEFIPEIVNYTLDNPSISYYLEGLDKEYKKALQSELGGIVYTNLPAGEYTFHLAIMDKNSGIPLEESTYSFQKEKSIHDNRYFIVYLLVVGGIFLGWLSWFLTRTALERTIQLQQERLALALKQVQMGNETILAIAKTVDAKDTKTSKHSQRVAEYSVLIAKEYGFTEEEQENLRKAALLHDIGKIGIPDAVLNKPSRLTDDEYQIMKTHVVRGSEILKDFTLIDHVVEGARFHHERYDGKGYPDGLSEDEIPLYGRIISIADAFDAMTANRVYRKQQDFSYVMDELHKGRGTQFDPELLDIFLRLIENGNIDITALYAENREEDKNETGKE